MVVLAGAASILTCVAGIVGAVFRKGVRGRWLWVLACLLGVGQFTFDWSTGFMNFHPIGVEILGAAYARGPSPTDPWIITLGFPLGALLFFAKRDVHRAWAVSWRRSQEGAR